MSNIIIVIKLSLFSFSYQDKELFEECQQEYLKKREDYQKDFAQSGKSANLMKKESTI